MFMVSACCKSVEYHKPVVLTAICASNLVDYYVNLKKLPKYVGKCLNPEIRVINNCLSRRDGTILVAVYCPK